MDRDRILSGSDLVKQHASRDHTIPLKGGCKEFENDGSWMQAKRLSYFYDSRQEILGEDRMEKLNNLVKGTWDPVKNLVQFEKEMGKFWSNMGFVDQRRKWLYPEEALFLMEANLLQVVYNEIPLSIQEAYNEFMSDNFQLQEYQVYCHLRRHGYLVRRHEPLPTDYEVSIKLNQHVKKSRKRRQKNKMLNEDKTDVVPEKQRKIIVDDASREFDDRDDNLLPDPTRTESKDNLPSPVDITNESMSQTHRNTGVVNDMLDSMECDVSNTDIIVTSMDNKESTLSKEDNSLSNDREKISQLVDVISIKHNIKFDMLHNSISSFCATENTKWETKHTQWDYSKVSFPNIANIDLVSVDIPDNDFIPNGIDVEKIECFNVRDYLSKKPQQYFDLDTDPSSLHFSYQDWLKSQTHKAPSNWTEYKSRLCDVQRHLAVNNPAEPLWKGEVTPLVKPEDATSTANILNKLRIIKSYEDEEMKSDMSENSSNSKISFDVFLPNANFKKSDPGRPNHRVCVTRSCDEPPNLLQMNKFNLKDKAPVHWAVLDNGDVAFYSFQDLNLPCDISKG